MYQTIELFRRDEVTFTLDERVSAAMDAVKGVFEKNHVCQVSYSSGKDSGVVASLVLSAARLFVEAGGSPVVSVVTSDTGVENPEIVGHFRAELVKMRAYATQHGFRLQTQIVQPNMASSWQVTVLSGRALPSFAGLHADCTDSLKIQPSRVYRNRFAREMKAKGYGEPVVCLGTRYDESERRNLNMKARGDRADAPIKNRDGELILCPVAHWTVDDIWEFIGEVSSGLRESFTDFEETKRIYAHAGNTSCAVVADTAVQESRKKRSGRCGARTGCFVCQQAQDVSLENMIDYSDERYGYARGLNRFNKFLRATRYDWTLRHWVGRTIKNGYIAIEPDTYHPRMVRALFRMMLTLQFDEQQRARRAGEQPKFTLLSDETIVAIDAMQSLNGLAAPFAAWADWRDIYERGIRYDVPDVPTAPKTDMPEVRFLFVGREWDDTADSQWTGLRDPLFEALTEGSPCQPEVLTLPNGRETWKVPTQQAFGVDAESAMMLRDFEMDRMLAEYDSGFHPGGITAGYRFYLTYGAVTLSHSQQREHDEIARRTAYKDRLGLTLDYNIDQLTAKAVAFSSMPADARRAWAKKATTDSAQIAFDLAA